MRVTVCKHVIAPLPASPRWGEEQKTPSPSGGGPGWGLCSMAKTKIKANFFHSGVKCV